MISMKRTAEEKKSEDHSEAICMDERDDYPWGLSIDLDEETMEKLEFSGKIGDEFTLVAKVCVKSTHESASDNHSNKTASLQITDMDLTKKADEKSAEELLYGEGDS